MSKKIKIISLILCIMMAFCAIPFAACSNSGERVNVVYHLNYDGAEDRTVQVYTGTSALDWKAPREGFKLEGWYSDANCKNKYDFSQRIKKDTNLYAAWKVYEGRALVTFDYNYPGCRLGVTASVERDEIIEEKYIPADASRKGMKQTGWYKDAAATQKWDFATDKPNGDITLYAGYEHSDTIRRDTEGNPIYENVQVNVWLSGNGMDTEIYQKIAEQFNKEYEGKISVNATEALSDQGTFSLRSQNTPEKSVNESTYYSVNDIYAMAGIELDYGDWYEGALKDSIYNRAMTSVPMFANVPYLVYNKQLLQKYNGGVLPTNYTELSALLKKAYEGENSTEFTSMHTNLEWSFKEGPAHTAFVQNSAEYYSYSDGFYLNNWANNRDNALTALKNTYSLFSHNSSLHCGNSGNTAEPVNRVIAGTSLFGLVTWIKDSDGVSRNVINNSSVIGAVPLSGLFTDADTPEAARIPVNTFGLAFYKAQNCSDTQLAAAAVFADYCSKHSYMFTEKGWAPVRKSAYDAEKMDDFYKDLILTIGKPENFYTYDGYKNGKQIYNKIASETYFIPLFDETNPDFDKVLTDFTAAVCAELQ